MAATVRRTVVCVALVSALLQPGGAARQPSPGGIDVDVFFRVAAPDDRVAEAALAQIADAWKDGYAALFVDVLDLMRRTSPARRRRGPCGVRKSPFTTPTCTRAAIRRDDHDDEHGRQRRMRASMSKAQGPAERGPTLDEADVHCTTTFHTAPPGYVLETCEKLRVPCCEFGIAASCVRRRTRAISVVAAEVSSTLR